MHPRIHIPLATLAVALAACGGGAPAGTGVGAESFVSQPPGMGMATAASPQFSFWISTLENAPSMFRSPRVETKTVSGAAWPAALAS